MLRLCQVLAFHFSTYPQSVYRLKKPFNPLLGETYELCYKGMRFVAEQVSHHPPISAFYLDAEEFVVEGSDGGAAIGASTTTEAKPDTSFFGTADRASRRHL